MRDRTAAAAAAAPDQQQQQSIMSWLPLTLSATGAWGMWTAMGKLAADDNVGFGACDSLSPSSPGSALRNPRGAQACLAGC